MTQQSLFAHDEPPKLSKKLEQDIRAAERAKLVEEETAKMDKALAEHAWGVIGNTDRLSKMARDLYLEQLLKKENISEYCKFRDAIKRIHNS